MYFDTRQGETLFHHLAATPRVSSPLSTEEYKCRQLIWALALAGACAGSGSDQIIQDITDLQGDALKIHPFPEQPNLIFLLHV